MNFILMQSVFLRKHSLKLPSGQAVFMNKTTEETQHLHPYTFYYIRLFILCKHSAALWFLAWFCFSLKFKHSFKLLVDGHMLE